MACFVFLSGVLATYLALFGTVLKENILLIHFIKSSHKHLNITECSLAKCFPSFAREYSFLWQGNKEVLICLLFQLLGKQTYLHLHFQIHLKQLLPFQVWFQVFWGVLCPQIVKSKYSLISLMISDYQKLFLTALWKLVF